MPKRSANDLGPVGPAPKRTRATRNRRYPRQEFKSLDVSASATTVDTTGSVTLLNGCIRGSDISNREGREILMKSLQLKVYVAANGQATGDQLARVMIVYDRQSNGTALTPTEVIDGCCALGMRNLENKRRFKILHDMVFTLNATYDGATTWNQNPGQHYYKEIYRKINLPVTFGSGNAGSVTDISTGSLYMVRIGTVAAGTAAAACSFTSRIRFTDQ